MPRGRYGKWLRRTCGPSQFGCCPDARFAGNARPVRRVQYTPARVVLVRLFPAGKMGLTVDIVAHDAPDAVGGPYVWISRFPLELQKLGFRVRIRLLGWQNLSDGVVYQALKRNGLEFTAANYRDTETNMRWLLSAMQEQPPNIFVPNLSVPAFYAGKYLKQSGIPTVGILRSDDPFYAGITDRFVCGSCDYRVSAIVCVSEYLKNKVSERKPRAVEVRKIPSGTPVPQAIAQPPRETLRIAYVGRLVEQQKRISETARALARATREIPGVEAVLFGDGPARPQVEQVLAQEGAPAVRIAGRVSGEEIQKFLLDCHVIALLSDYEGTPMAVMEAMACGCVPVCLRIRSGVPELVEEGVTGLLVEDRAEGFVNAIRRLRCESGLWDRLARAARARIEGSYSIRACAAQWAELLRHLHAASGPQRPIRIPKRFRLPPIHPGLACEDFRSPPPPPLYLRLYRRARKTVAPLKRHLLRAKETRT